MHMIKEFRPNPFDLRASTVTPHLEPRDTGAAPGGPSGGGQSVERRLGLRGAIFRLATGKAAAMVIGLAAAPVITRLYQPENFGTVAILTTLVAILTPSATLSYVRAIPLAADRADRRDLVLLCCAILLVGLALLSIATYAGAETLAQLYGVKELASYALVLPLLFLIFGVDRIITMLLNCERRYSIVAIRTVLGSAVGATCTILAGLLFFRYSTAGLLLGTLAGAIVGTMFSGFTVVRNVLCRVDAPVRISAIRGAASQHRKFPQFTNWGLTINAVTRGLPVFLLAAFFPLQVVGFYALADRLLKVPLKLFTAASSQVFYIEAAACFAAARNARVVTLELVRTLSALSTFPLVGLFVLAPAIFSTAFGSDWREAGVYAQVMAPWLLFMTIASPLSGIYMVSGRHREGLAADAVFVAGGACALMLGGGVIKAAVPTLILFSLAGSVAHAWRLFRCVGLAGVSRRAVGTILVKKIAESAVLLAPAAVIAWWYQSDLLALLFGSLAMCLYIVILFRRHKEPFGRIILQLCRSSGDHA